MIIWQARKPYHQVRFIKLVKQITTVCNEFGSHWMLHNYDLLPDKVKLCKLKFDKSFNSNQLASVISVLIGCSNTVAFCQDKPRKYLSIFVAEIDMYRVFKKFCIILNKECSVLLIEHMYLNQDCVDTVNSTCWLSISCLCNHQTMITQVRKWQSLLLIVCSITHTSYSLFMI